MANLEVTPQPFSALLVVDPGLEAPLELNMRNRTFTILQEASREDTYLVLDDFGGGLAGRE